MMQTCTRQAKDGCASEQRLNMHVRSPVQYFHKHEVEHAISGGDVNQAIHALCGVSILTQHLGLWQELHIMYHADGEGKHA
jgi:hypothetical protein